MNNILFFTINQLAGHNYWLDEAMIVITKYGPLLFIGLLLWTYMQSWRNNHSQKRAQVVSIGIYTGLCLLLSGIIGQLWYEPRPFLTHSTVQLLLPHAANASFPSNHAIGTMAIAMGFLYIQPKVGKLLFLFSLVIGFSRVFVGHHYPFDVLGGFMLVWITFYGYVRYLATPIEHLYLNMEKNLPIKNLTAHKKKRESL